MSEGPEPLLQTLSIRCMNLWDRAYHRYHRLEAVGPLLMVGSRRYAGAQRRFADGTVLAAGDWLGTLHFNNVRIASLGSGRGRHLTAWQFARQLRESLDALAAYSVSRAGESPIVYQGTTWMQPHGLTRGFSCDPLPNGWRKRLLRWHFRVLRACFAPATFRNKSRELEPCLFWITRTELRRHFGRSPT